MVKIRFSSFSSQDSGINPFEELLLESVEELDFAEDELFVDEDDTGLPPEDVSLPVTELEEIASSQPSVCSSQ